MQMMDNDTDDKDMDATRNSVVTESRARQVTHKRVRREAAPSPAVPQTENDEGGAGCDDDVVATSATATKVKRFRGAMCNRRTVWNDAKSLVELHAITARQLQTGGTLFGDTVYDLRPESAHHFPHSVDSERTLPVVYPLIRLARDQQWLCVGMGCGGAQRQRRRFQSDLQYLYREFAVGFVPRVFCRDFAAVFGRTGCFLLFDQSSCTWHNQTNTTDCVGAPSSLHDGHYTAMESSNVHRRRFDPVCACALDTVLRESRAALRQRPELYTQLTTECVLVAIIDHVWARTGMISAIAQYGHLHEVLSLLFSSDLLEIVFRYLLDLIDPRSCPTRLLIAGDSDRISTYVHDADSKTIEQTTLVRPMATDWHMETNELHGYMQAARDQIWHSSFGAKVWGLLYRSFSHGNTYLKVKPYESDWLSTRHDDGRIGQRPSIANSTLQLLVEYLLSCDASDERFPTGRRLLVSVHFPRPRVGNCEVCTMSMSEELWFVDSEKSVPQMGFYVCDKCACLLEHLSEVLYWMFIAWTASIHSSHEYQTTIIDALHFHLSFLV